MFRRKIITNVLTSITPSAKQHWRNYNTSTTLLDFPMLIRSQCQSKLQILESIQKFYPPPDIGIQMEGPMNECLLENPHVKNVAIQKEFLTKPGEKIKRPDAVVTLQNGKVVVVDSKVSTFTSNYPDKINRHVDELSDAAYHDFVPGAEPFTIMFLPSLVYLEELWKTGNMVAVFDRAAKKKILIAIPETIDIVFGNLPNDRLMSNARDWRDDNPFHRDVAEATMRNLDLLKRHPQGTGIIGTRVKPFSGQSSGVSSKF